MSIKTVFGSLKYLLYLPAKDLFLGTFRKKAVRESEIKKVLEMRKKNQGK